MSISDTASNVPRPVLKGPISAAIIPRITRPAISTPILKLCNRMVVLTRGDRGGSVRRSNAAPLEQLGNLRIVECVNSGRVQPKFLDPLGGILALHQPQRLDRRFLIAVDG